MKIARTFTIDFLVAEQLKELRNQSAFVNAAVKARLASLNDEKPVVTVSWWECPSCLIQKSTKSITQWQFCECDERMRSISAPTTSQ